MIEQLIQRFKEMFDCDTARISSPLGKRMFLIIGFRRNTKQDAGQWYRNGEPVHFDYTHERCIASGDTEAELIASAEEYKRLQSMDWPAYFGEMVGRDIAPPLSYERVNR